MENFRKQLPVKLERVLVKTERQSICYLCEELSVHDSETWPMKVEHELKLNRTEMSMIRWMCGVKLSERNGLG